MKRITLFGGNKPTTEDRVAKIDISKAVEAARGRMTGLIADSSANVVANSAQLQDCAAI
ncbi:hypothetical protein [Ostreiculturibacter nitratireducens]|uniref:hypothetical protein n=1 Tax=Ostreiculturibacter nitratireducens TaxID=3075226 RepID=UPI0031B57247